MKGLSWNEESASGGILNFHEGTGLIRLSVIDSEILCLWSGEKMVEICR